MYKGIFKVEETVDHQVLLDEFRSTVSMLDFINPGVEDWKGIVLFDVNGRDELARTPYLREVLDGIGMEHVLQVAFYKLNAGAALHRHRDMYGNLLVGISRLQIPVQTNPGASLEVQRVNYHLRPGEIWCLDTSAVHRAVNDGDEDRIHLIIDVKRAPATEKYFPKSNLSVYLHLARFCLVMSAKLLRDLVRRPSSVLGRLKTMFRISKKGAA